WAQRVIWTRKIQMSAALQEINWAREVINDPARRLRADLTSLNPDTIDRVLREVVQRLGAARSSALPWQPLDVEKALADYTPDIPVPDAAAVRAAIVIPSVPEEVPG